MFVIFDLDGTLALDGHRQHHLHRRPRDWDAYHRACGGDRLCEAVAQVLLTHLARGHVVEIWTGRSEAVRDLTDDWMRRCCIPPGLVARMRPAGDERDTAALKRAWLREVRVVGRPEPDLVYEDMSSVVAMWREEGIPCFQVAPQL